MIAERTSVVAQLKTSLRALAVFTVLTGLVYPLVITGVAQLVFHSQANGSLIVPGGRALGSELIGQPFDDPRYFWSRPSATVPFPYNAASSSGSNLAVTNPAQIDAVSQRVKHLRDTGVAADQRIPADLVTASGSGLDPDISPAAARLQAARVARAGGMSEADVLRLIAAHTAGRQLGVLGEPRVNVLLLNLSLDKVAAGPTGARAGR